MKAILRPALLLAAVLLMFGMFSAQAASISIPDSGADLQTKSISANVLKPSSCAAINLSQIIAGSTLINGTAGNDLILGSPGIDIINGNGGDDCILGGGGIDTLSGGLGTDVCIGGPGLDLFDLTCETQIQ